ncbi:peptide chain release factor N(5)-glutamine methyltransferase [Novispirillum sp. DQ9]|uniref:peptide chain release factor N(5)-glutamine methyltransferase n=1 Tax=Novispirillum sp. DQ9 TaxID=3398612 RepID=UPI003C7D4170
MITAGAAAEALARRFAAAGIDTSRLDARMLVAHVLDIRPQDILLRSDTALTADQAEALELLARRREAREPVSRILGRRGFWSFDLSVGPDTLDPRPDTESVVEAVLAGMPDRAAPLRILDLGTGTGCILLALLAEYPRATGIGLDIAPGAVATATSNAAALGLADRARFVVGDWADDWGDGLEASGLDGLFDVVVSNPPYIPDGDIAGLEPEVREHDPWRALAGGDDGLTAYRLLAPLVAPRVSPGGMVAFEVGIGQAADVSALLAAAGFDMVWNQGDLGGVERCICARVAVPHAGAKNRGKR